MKLIYVVGAVLLVTTIHAWVKNIRILIHGKRQYTPTDKLLNYPLLFLWLTFMTVFSLGMIINN